MKTDATQSANDGKGARGFRFPDGTPAMLKRAEICELVGYRLRTWSRHVAAGHAPSAVHVGGMTRWQREVVENWVADGCPPVRKGARR